MTKGKWEGYGNGQDGLVWITAPSSTYDGVLEMPFRTVQE